MAQGLSRMLGEKCRLHTVAEEHVPDNLTDDTAVVMMTQVNYRTGRLHPMDSITRHVQKRGALMLWDLSHSAGVIPIDLNGCHVDMAVGCGYKYLNGGPGAPAFLFLAERHLDKSGTVLTGWLGHADPFGFSPEYQPASSISRFQCGTPAILGQAALEVGLDLALQADISLVREKSKSLTALFINLVEQECPSFFELASPANAVERGSQVSLHHAQGYAIVQALIANGVIPDFRKPDILRFGFAPLYTRYQDVYQAVNRLARIMRDRSWDRPEHLARKKVT
jgi:kynureninase